MRASAGWASKEGSVFAGGVGAYRQHGYEDECSDVGV